MSQAIVTKVSFIKIQPRPKEVLFIYIRYLSTQYLENIKTLKVNPLGI